MGVTGATEEMIAAGVTAMIVAEAIVMKAHVRKTVAEVAHVGKTRTRMTNVRKTATRVLLLRRKIAMTVRRKMIAQLLERSRKAPNPRRRISRKAPNPRRRIVTRTISERR